MTSGTAQIFKNMSCLKSILTSRHLHMHTYSTFGISPRFFLCSGLLAGVLWAAGCSPEAAGTGTGKLSGIKRDRLAKIKDMQEQAALKAKTKSAPRPR
jgi:hypothetical protein